MPQATPAFDPHAVYNAAPPAFDPSANYAADNGAATQKDQPGWLDKEIPLDSYSKASLSGLQSILRGGRDALKGTWDTLATPPKDKTEMAVAAIGTPGAVPLYRTLRALGHSAEQATQLVGAIHDINQSPDPTGTYAKAAQETAGEGAGQALLALGTEGVARGVPKVVEATKAVAQSPVVRAAAAELPKAAIRRIPYVGKVAGDVYSAAKSARATPALDATGENIPYAGEAPPPASALTRGGQSVVDPAAGLGQVPVRAQKTLADLGDAESAAAPAKKVPAKVVKQSKSLGPNAQVLNQSQTLGQLTPPKTLADLANPQTPPQAAPAVQGDISSRVAAQMNKIKAEQAATPAAAPAEEDLTSILQKSLDQVKAKKSGISTTAAPSDLMKRWGVDAESLAEGREQTRGMTPEETESDISKLADRYKKGQKVDPVVEMRDADNNIVSVDGRARAIAAQRAGVERIPIIVRRMKTLSALQ